MIKSRSIQYSQDVIQELLNYDSNSGVFRWNLRSREWFKTSRSFKSWNSRFAFSDAGHVGKDQHVHISILGRIYKAHRLAYTHYYGVDLCGAAVIHLDGDASNNSINNLQLSYEHRYNIFRRPWGKSRLKGVTTTPNTGKWRSQIANNGKVTHLGLFNSEQEAATKYDSAVLKLLGSSAGTNASMGLL